MKTRSRHTPAITIVNNWHTSIAHTLRSGSSQRGSRRVVPQTTLPKKERGLHHSLDDIWATIHTFSRNLSNWANQPLVANIKDCNLRTLPSTRQLAHSSEQTDRSTCPATKKTFKKYTPTPIAAETFPNFISGTGTVRRPELFEQFCVPIKNSWLLFSWNYLRKSKNWISFEDLECGVRRPANLHLPLKSYVGH